MNSTPTVFEWFALEGANLGTTVYRGYAPLSEQARVSTPDTYDQDDNPTGTQRDLNRAHAQKAYFYAKEGLGALGERQLWPELIYNVRDPSVLDIDPIEGDLPELPDGQRLVRLRFHLDRIDRGRKTPQVSRVDGNHRLFYADGGEIKKGLEASPLDRLGGFMLTIGLSPAQESAVFSDINNNHQGMNTSHLVHLQARLMSTEELKPEVDFAARLADDPHSPFHGIVYKGGSKKGARSQGLKRPVNLSTLKTGLRMLFNRSIKLDDLREREHRYLVVRNFWSAVKEVYVEEWASPKEYLLLKGLGIYAFSYVAAHVIDRCLVRGLTDVADMAAYVRQTRKVTDWSVNGVDLRGVTGLVGAKIVGSKLCEVLSDDLFQLDQVEQQLKEALRREDGQVTA